MERKNAVEAVSLPNSSGVILESSTVSILFMHITLQCDASVIHPWENSPNTIFLSVIYIYSLKKQILDLFNEHIHLPVSIGKLGIAELNSL